MMKKRAGVKRVGPTARRLCAFYREALVSILGGGMRMGRRRESQRATRTKKRRVIRTSKVRVVTRTRGMGKRAKGMQMRVGMSSAKCVGQPTT